MNAVERSNKIRKYFREYNEISTIHGFRYLSEKRSRFEKILWFFIILVSLTGCIYMICEIIKKYESSPVVLNFSSEDLPIYEIPFPAITICPEVKSSSKLFSYSDVYVKIINNQTEKISEIEKLYFSHLNLLCSDNWYEGPETVSEDFYHTFRKLAPNIAINCYRREIDYKFSEYFTPIITDQGICFSYNILDRSEIFRDNVPKNGYFYQVNKSSKYFGIDFGYSPEAGVNTYPQRALISGSQNSLDIYMNYNSNDSDVICNGFFQGFRVLIHNPWVVPQLSNYYFRVPFDTVVVAAVDPELISTSEEVAKFKPEKRKCFMSNEKPLKFFKIYTQSNCFMECLANYTLQKCGCVEFYMPRENKTLICGSGSYNCTENAQNELKTEELEMKISGHIAPSFCDCKPECTSLDYHVEISHSTFYWRKFYKSRQKLGLDKPENFSPNTHYSVLSIYLKNEQFKYLERNQLYGISDFISNFGGLLGLFTGFSLISLAEIIYYCTMRIYCNYKMYHNWNGK